MPNQLTATQRVLLWISSLLKFSLLIAAIASLIFDDWITAFLSVLILFLTFLPAILHRNWRILLPTELELIVVFFIFTSLYLGEIHNFYYLFSWWDLFLHTLSGISFGMIGFLLLFTLSTQHKISASPSLICFFSFCFALAIGGLWEMFEYVMDLFFPFQMQEGSLDDTMSDLMLDAIGALITASIAYPYLRKSKEGVVRRAVEKVVRKSAQH